MTEQYVKREAADYAAAFNALLPTGPAWPRDPTTVPQKVIAGLAEIWGDEVEGLANLLLTRESDPRAAITLLPEWERAWGLPDKCLTEPLTIDARHTALMQKMTLLGAQSRAFFIEQAAIIGYTISITEYSPFQCGISRCGDTTAQNPEDPSRMRWQIGPPEIRFYWTVHVDALALRYFHVSAGQCGVDPLLFIGLATDLECLIRRYKPAHTEVLFDYSQGALDFSKPFNSGYLIMGYP